MTPLEKSYREIPLTKGQIAIVDAADYESISQHKWYAHAQSRMGLFYAARRVRLPDGRSVISMMHREILGLPHEDPRFVDHKHRDNTLDNRRSNLRTANRKQNDANSRLRITNRSGYRGVSFSNDGRPNPWYVQIQNDGKNIFLGRYRTAEDGARAYDRKNLELRGEFAILNFPEQQAIR